MDTLRDRPEISPWSASEKLDCTTLTEEVSMTPTPEPMRKSPGTKLSTPDVELTSASSSAIPAAVSAKPDRISSPCGRRLASRPAAAELSRIPAIAGVSISPVWIAL